MSPESIPASEPVARPRRWRFADAFPMNAQGKVREADLRALFRPERPPYCGTVF